MRPARLAHRDGHRGGNRDDRRLAESLRPERAGAEKPFEELDLDRRDLPERGDPVVEQPRVLETAVLRPDRFLGERGPEAHGHPALDLGEGGGKVDDHADIVEGRVPFDPDRAGLPVHRDLRDVGGPREVGVGVERPVDDPSFVDGPGPTEVPPARDEPSRTPLLRGQQVRDRRLAVPDPGDPPTPLLAEGRRPAPAEAIPQDLPQFDRRIVDRSAHALRPYRLP